ncbi:MAG: hypothetical protein GY937_28685 [bacterium]|nr:hypothetical protein [bacterium]
MIVAYVDLPAYSRLPWFSVFLVRTYVRGDTSYLFGDTLYVCAPVDRWRVVVEPHVMGIEIDNKRLYTVLDQRLADNEYLAGDYGLAEITNWSRVRLHGWAGIEIDDLPHLARWLEAVGARPAVQRSFDVPVERDEPRKEAAEKIAEQAQKLLQA